VPQVLIRHPKTGEEYGIDSSDFRRGHHYEDPKSGDRVSYADAGFRIVSLADGSEYTGPLNESPAERSESPKS
jgi:hypothetical protein